MTVAEHLEALVAYDTTSRNSNLPLIRYVEQVLDASGVAAERLPDPGGDTAKASLLARVGPDRDGGVVLCGHTDTVPVDGQAWDTDPFRLTDVGRGWLAGRGTVDMKGYLAAVLAAVPDMTASSLQRPVWIALTHDEEIGCLAAPAMAARLRDAARSTAIVVVGEPTQRAVIRSHKGLSGFRTTVRGRDAHSSQPHNGASAIEAAAEVVRIIYAAAAERRRDGVRAEGFTPPHTTMNVGQIRGGSAINIIPGSCEIVWEFRPVPGEDVDTLRQHLLRRIEHEALPALQAQHPDVAITTEVVASSPPLPATGNAEAAALLADLTGAGHAQPVSFGTDGAAIQAAGLPTVIHGPGRLDQMHQPNERIETDDLKACASDIAALIGWASRPIG